MLAADVDFVCVATPDDRHFAAAQAALAAGKHVLIEKPSVLTLAELDELERLAREHRRAGQGGLSQAARSRPQEAPHAGRRRRTAARQQRLLHAARAEERFPAASSPSGSPAAIPGTYVAVHYIKLIDFTFGGRLKSVALHRPARPGRAGRRHRPGTRRSCGWSTATTIGREAAFDIHTSWVTPDNFPGYVEQEVQFRFDNGVWNGHSRKRGVECTVEGRTPLERKITMNNHYNGTFLEPWSERSQRGYGIEVLERFVREVATSNSAGRPASAHARLQAAARRWRTTICRPIGKPWPPCRRWKRFSPDMPPASRIASSKSIIAAGGLVLLRPGTSDAEVLYAGRDLNLPSRRGGIAAGCGVENKLR